MLEDEVFDLAHLMLDSLSKVGVVDENAEFEAGPPQTARSGSRSHLRSSDAQSGQMLSG